MRIAVLSPHADDAVFSVGEHMLSRPDDEFTVLVPCGEVPNVEPHQSKYERLLAEHAEVMERGGWKSFGGPFGDDAAFKDGFGPSMLDDYLAEWLDTRTRGYDEIWAPAGIGHPDHIATRDAADEIDWGLQRVLYYEELPYRVLYPWGAYCRERGLQDSGRQWDLVGFGPRCDQPDLLQAKQRLCRLYASQIGWDIERCLYAPERLWRVK